MNDHITGQEQLLSPGKGTTTTTRRVCVRARARTHACTHPPGPGGLHQDTSVRHQGADRKRGDRFSSRKGLCQSIRQSQEENFPTEAASLRKSFLNRVTTLHNHHCRPAPTHLLHPEGKPPPAKQVHPFPLPAPGCPHPPSVFLGSPLLDIPPQ